MAINQATILLIPDEFINSTSFEIDNLFDTDGYNDSSLAWKNYPNSSDLNVTIDKYFKRGKQWHEDIVSWGDEQESDIQLIFEDNSVTDFVIRLSVNKEFDEWIEKVNVLSKEISCSLFLPTSKLIFKPDSEMLKAAITKILQNRK